MYGKKYFNIIERIGILQKHDDTEELRNFSKKFKLACMRCVDLGESDLDCILTNKNITGKLNLIAKKYPANIQTEYYKIPVEFNDKTDILNCEKCSNLLLFKQGRAYCDQCGFTKIVGQSYYGMALQKKHYKSKENMDKYCENWFERLQGKGLMLVPADVYSELFKMAQNRCKNDCRYVINIKCDDIRSWLSLMKKADLNQYIPALHWRITRELGYEIVPPQFSEEEKQVVLEDWRYVSATYCQEYKKLKHRASKSRNNMPYYPICILFIVNKRFPDDPRAKRLDEYVYKQTIDTYKLRLQCWEETCRILNYTGSGRY